MDQSATYQMRGNRVSPMKVDEITNKAINFCNEFGLTPRRKKKKRYDDVFEMLAYYGITLDVMEDRAWEKITLDLTIGHCDPSTLTITVPKRIYEMASMGERSALSIMMHELGHLLLGHKPVLHFSNTHPLQIEDAEWQADTFAEVVLERMGYSMAQLTFDFYM
ncbi:TPA: ImmA/IrrE family metallo-endopeptidase [Yersinia enterocolitica]|nr:ImmA/IrrE family metallo-endopeptidase [Yersinia enterocolitica]EKN4936396.1 ImmA/IrrE family metallo-endopeptidase [Yersinia enterocolitica]EKN5052786.1 ImmA/IrrE family metallo-endopeptidase [Yersinia enterocolitica]EKN5146454.1 ImmA/IrrE family metallo-endopeptidase [Yersinia enterocolitica]EKN6371097.1 ImmA/IrrE family metallo-endopeptidase [Yersinia enterocolitica]